MVKTKKDSVTNEEIEPSSGVRNMRKEGNDVQAYSDSVWRSSISALFSGKHYFEKEDIKEFCLMTDDLWLKSMAVKRVQDL